MVAANNAKEDPLFTGDDCTHILSKLSRTLDRDTFVFWPSVPARLLVGVNQRLAHMSSSALNRWLSHVRPPLPDAELRPVTVQKYDILRYAVCPRGEMIAAVDTTPLPAGDYGFFPKDPARDWAGNIKGFAVHPRVSFENRLKLNEEYFYPGINLELYTFPSSLEQAVRLRDKQCFITGAEPDADLAASWVFPPTWAYLLDAWPNPGTCDYTPFLTASNACMMRRDLLHLFHDNAFGIDVDDNYRIVVFREMGRITLPSYIPKSQNTACAGPDDRFLREHFIWCILVNLFGGDISEDYDTNDIIRVMEELGVSGDAELAPVDDERWNTVIGKELWEDVMRDKLYWADDEPMSDEIDQVLQGGSAP